MGMISEFKEFIAKGNVVDLAVGVVIGAAFGKIVTALVDGIIMPAIGAMTGSVRQNSSAYSENADESSANAPLILALPPRAKQSRQVNAPTSARPPKIE